MRMTMKRRLLRVLDGLIRYQGDWRKELIEKEQFRGVAQRDSAITMLEMVRDMVEDERVLVATEQGLGKYLDGKGER